MLNGLDQNKIFEEVKDQVRIRRSQHINNAIFTNYGMNKRIPTSRLILNIFTDSLKNFGATAEEYDALKRMLIALDPILRIMFTGSTEKNKSLEDDGNGLNNVMRHFRTILRNSIPNGKYNDFYKQSFGFFGLTSIERLVRREKYRDAVMDKNNRRKELRPIYVEDLFNLMNNLVTLPYTKNNYADKLILALLCSGCRTVEILEKSRFEKVEISPIDTNDIKDDDKKYKPHRIRVFNLAKKSPKMSNVYAERNLLVIDSDEMIRLVKWLREHRPYESWGYFIETMNKRFNILFSFHNSNDKNDICNITMRYCRVIYANLNFKVNAEKDLIPYESFLQYELGHSDSLSTRSYLCINLQYKEKEKQKEDKKSEIKSQDPLLNSIPLLKDENNDLSDTEQNILKNMLELYIDGTYFTQSDIKRIYDIGSHRMKKIFKVFNQKIKVI